MSYTKTEIIGKIEKDIRAVEIIRSSEDNTKCCVVLNDRMFSTPFETEFSFDLVLGIKEAVSEDAIVLMFVDNELPEAWRQSYLQGGIEEERHDRRVIFHPYNDMNEMFCIDEMLFDDITDYWKGTPRYENRPKWKVGIIKWYKNHLI